MQAGAMGGDDLCVVAPLFFEAIHVLVRAESPLTHVDQIGGNEVAVGPTGSGSRLATEMLLESLGFPPSTTPRRVLGWPELVASGYVELPTEVGNATAVLTQATAPQIAIICIGKKSRLVQSLVAGVDGKPGKWRLLDLPSAIEISLQHPILRPMGISADDYPAANLPSAGLSTVGTTAFLAATWQTPDRLVTAALEAIYKSPEEFPGLISRDRATEWQGLGFHPAARRYFAAR
ncbi:MAG TPA: hypothetical protein DDZ51_25090 [Planctomycetaceae bacterium]|nr:hypothetical protein [Planctomycetaceae bacterium]